MALVLYTFHSRTDIARLLGAFIGTGLVVALLGMAQYFLFRDQLKLEPDNVRRVHAIYGSANSIGLFFDYVIPLLLALVAVPLLRRRVAGSRSWVLPVLAGIISLPLLLVLYLSQSGGAWLAVFCAALFVGACSLRSRRALLLGGTVLAVVLVIGLLLFHRQITRIVLDRHVNTHGVSTVTKRIYLWESALHMIKDSPIFGYGMDNWLCHFSNNTACYTPGMHHYWITTVPGTNLPTGLKDDPSLSHPHNIFLHVWVSMGVFGLLAFLAVLVLFFWLFRRVLLHIRSSLPNEHGGVLEWLTIGVGGAMVAALVQGMVDSSFLEQDLAFCFWMLVVALLLLRVFSGTPWRGTVRPKM